jgi:hypothetical protein
MGSSPPAEAPIPIIVCSAIDEDVTFSVDTVQNFLNDNFIFNFRILQYLRTIHDGKAEDIFSRR